MTETDTIQKMTVPEAIEFLDGKGRLETSENGDTEHAGNAISSYLYNMGIRKPNLHDNSVAALSVVCPVATWLKQVTGKPVLVGICNIFVFEIDPVVAEFPTPVEEYPIPNNIRDFVLYLEYFTRSWETEKVNENEEKGNAPVKDEGGQGES